MPAKGNSNEIKIVRVYDAPVEAVWDAWTDPSQVAQWWGPRGFTLTTHAKDLRPGGIWKYTMHGPDGVDYPNITRYLEVVEHAKLVYDHGATEDKPPLFRVTVHFSARGRRTKMEMVMTLPTPDAAQETRAFIKRAGGDATWDRLAEYLHKRHSDRERFVIARAFDAPLELLFDLWTDPQHLCQWQGPKGFEMQLFQADIRKGGRSSYMMSNGKDLKMYGRADYLEVERPRRIVYRQQFTDEQGNVARHPLVPTWPETMLTTVEFEQEEPGRTRVTVTWEPYGSVSAEEMETFTKSRMGMTQGWTGSFDKLEALLETMSTHN